MSQRSGWKRRTFLATPAAVVASKALAAGSARTWLGEGYFANRYQDWQWNAGRIECLANGAGEEIRTVGILQRSLHGGPAKLKVRLGVLEDAGGGGFAGFLIGGGAGKLDWRAAALVGRGSGEGGGLLCVCDTQGVAAFRDHSSESKPFTYAVEKQGSGGAAAAEWELVLDVKPGSGDTFHLRLEVFETKSHQSVSNVTWENVPAHLVRGGISLVSSPSPAKAGARFWFAEPEITGPGVEVHLERTFGPILGAMFSVNGKVLKLSAQIAPVGDADPQTAVLEVRRSGGKWAARGTSKLHPGFVAMFRVADWDATKDWEYRVVYGGTNYAGRIPRDPGTARPLRIGFVNCVMTAWRTMDSAAFQPTIPGERKLGRYTKDSVYFPHTEVVEGMRAHQPDLVAFLGDQIYEGNPTRKDQSENPAMDYLYKWSFWVWAFRELIRNTPSIGMVDDHDVFQGNVWGQGGRKAPDREQEAGGYTTSGTFVNIVQNTQCSHNPDAADPRPVEEGIGVYYGAFTYGGVEFAVVEDRKFKTGPQSEKREEPQLLGARQEAFLQQWAARVKAAPAKIVFTQTMFACVQTSPEGAPRKDTDSNGTPKPKRDLALRHIKQAGALMVCGDQHLASVVRHGVDSYTDGPLQFCGPGGGTSFQRWFEPSTPLPNAAGKHTGDFTDGYGNKFRVVAIANPKVSFAEYRKHKPPRGQGLGDRQLKSEGYGVVIVDHQARTFRLECWSWDVDPRRAGAKQFPGWPVTVKFSDA